MKSETFQIDILTPCFCAGAEPDKQAEIRAPSIRGQLRWWFRALGGFKSLSPMQVSIQETMIFGTITGNRGRAGKLIVRVNSQAGRKLVDSTDQQTPDMNSAEGYLLFPLRQQTRRKSALSSFSLTVLWHGTPMLWDSIQALVSVFGHLGSLGFRGRRAMGALAFSQDPSMSLKNALSLFASADNVIIKKLAATSANNAISVLGSWIKSCRAHGRSGQNKNEQASPYFAYAKRDHDIGYDNPVVSGQPSFRPALGLPIIQRTQKKTNNWHWEWNRDKRKGEGRFASPVILRPHRDVQGRWHALVIFVDINKWPERKNVYLNGQARNVSLDLYEAIKRDNRLQPFI